MAQVKECTNCGKTLLITEFSKCKANKDGKQFNCKNCNRISNKKFREEINPEHHANWQSNNRKRVVELVTKYRKASKLGGIIYYIHSIIDDKWYVGLTQTPIAVRLFEHRMKYKRFKLGKSVIQHPLLFESLDRWGWEGHRMGIIIKDKKVNRKQLREWEKECISFFMSKGISLNKTI